MSSPLQMNFGLPTICGLSNIFFHENYRGDMFERALEYAVPDEQRSKVVELASRLATFENETDFIDGFEMIHYQRIITTSLQLVEYWVFWGVYYRQSNSITKGILNCLDRQLTQGKITREVYDINHRNFITLFALLDKLAMNVGALMKKVGFDPYQMKTDKEDTADYEWLLRRNGDKSKVDIGMSFETKEVYKNLTTDTIEFVVVIQFEMTLKVPTHRCSICGTTFAGFGNSPYPFHLVNTNPCCDRCNTQSVIPARIRMIQQQNAKPTISEEEIIAIIPVVETETDHNKEKAISKEQAKKQQTRQANKAKADEKKRREEYERQVAEAQEHKKRQAEKKRKEIAKKKKDAQLKASQLFMEKYLEK
jgi:hypothetical protein